MFNTYTENEYDDVRALLSYPQQLNEKLGFMTDTSSIDLPEDPIEKVIFQERAKKAIRKIAQNKGHILLVGKPGTGKSMLANMFSEVVDQSMGDYLRPRKSIIAYPGKDKNHIRIAYANPEKLDSQITKIRSEIDACKNAIDAFTLKDQISSVRKVRHIFVITALLSIALGILYPVAFIVTGILGIGAIFMFIQENNHKVQEKIQNEAQSGRQLAVKHLADQLPEILYDPRKDKELIARVTEPNSINMRGGFRHDPYQSGNLHTPAHQRAFLGAHAKSAIIFIDELKTLINTGYMPNLLEIMQNQKYILEGGKSSGSGAADRSEDPLIASNIIIACCNHDTLSYLQEEGDGAFLSRIEDKGDIIQMEHAVPENQENLIKLAQYIKQEVNHIGDEFQKNWGEIFENEGHEGIRKRSEKIYGKPLPLTFRLVEKNFSKQAVAEIVKELRCRTGDRKLSCVLRPINGIIQAAVMEAIFDDSDLVQPEHVRCALNEHLSLEGELSKDLLVHKKDLKRYITSLTDAIGFVVGLSVVTSRASGQMYGQPLPIRCQVNAGGADSVLAPGKTGEIAKAAAQNVRASIKKIFRKIGAPYIGYEMHIEYIQAHGGVEGDSASIAMDIGLISDYIQEPVNQRFGITGSLTGDIILAVGGVTEKVRSIMDLDLDMQGACIPWQNRHDIEPLLINMDCELILFDGIPGVRIFRGEEKADPFDIYFLRTRYHAYKILMGIDEKDVEDRMVERSRKDLALIQGART
ncbi:MAG: ATP-binding protein [Proteobacteria bacterium]|nr:ATP-binding protein [Pseudomonadota bacterium]